LFPAPAPPRTYTLSLHDALPISALMEQTDGVARGRPDTLEPERGIDAALARFAHHSRVRPLTDGELRVLLDKARDARADSLLGGVLPELPFAEARVCRVSEPGLRIEHAPYLNDRELGHHHVPIKVRVVL